MSFREFSASAMRASSSVPRKRLQFLPNSNRSPRSTSELCDVGISRSVFAVGSTRSASSIVLGQGQNHLAVAGGCAASSERLRTHPLPRGGSDPVQVQFVTLRTKLHAIN